MIHTCELGGEGRVRVGRQCSHHKRACEGEQEYVGGVHTVIRAHELHARELVNWGAGKTD